VGNKLRLMQRMMEGPVVMVRVEKGMEALLHT